MPIPMAAPEVLDREFLELRAKLLELAASFDRLDRGEGSVADDPRMKSVRKGLQVLLEERGNRAEEIQMLFSLPYEEDWQQKYDIKPPSE